MFRTTPLPKFGLAILPRDLVKQDRIELGDLGAVLVIDVQDAGDFVFVTVSDGVRLVTTVRLHKLVPVPWFAASVARDLRAFRSVFRGLPWFVLAGIVGLAAGLAHAPFLGGQWAAIVVLWLVGCIRMATTPEVLR